jgi:hypothetical protein
VFWIVLRKRRSFVFLVVQQDHLWGPQSGLRNLQGENFRR